MRKESVVVVGPTRVLMTSVILKWSPSLYNKVCTMIPEPLFYEQTLYSRWPPLETRVLLLT